MNRKKKSYNKRRPIITDDVNELFAKASKGWEIRQIKKILERNQIWIDLINRKEFIP